MNFLAWYDDTRHHTAQQRVAAFVARYGTPPTLALVATGETATVAGVEVRESAGPGEGVVQKNTVWVAI